MYDNIISFLLIGGIIVTLYFYHEKIIKILYPYFDKTQKEIDESKEKERIEKDTEIKNENIYKNILNSINEIFNIPNNFLYKLGITYGIFSPKENISTI